jgi:hypothetical protein
MNNEPGNLRSPLKRLLAMSEAGLTTKSLAVTVRAALLATLLFTNVGTFAADKSGRMHLNFDSDKVGGLPAGANAFSGKWAVHQESDAPSKPNALCQTGTAQYPALSVGDTPYTDATITVRFKPISGNEDRAAGIVFRIQDKDNYYIVRANALENNVNIYRYKGGRRSAIKEGTKQVASGQWQELRVEVKGNTIKGFLNGDLAVEATDSTFKSGKIGLWTKADSTTCFDDFEVLPR